MTIEEFQKALREFENAVANAWYEKAHLHYGMKKGADAKVGAAREKLLGCYRRDCRILPVTIAAELPEAEG